MAEVTQAMIDAAAQEAELLFIIKKNRRLLAETDWKVIVNAEYIQAGLEPKYPTIHEERQAWRDAINAAEAELG